MSEEGVVGQVTESSGVPGRDKRVKVGFLALVQAVCVSTSCSRRCSDVLEPGGHGSEPRLGSFSCAIAGLGGSHVMPLAMSFLIRQLGPIPSSLWMVVKVRDRVGTGPGPGPCMSSEHSNSHCPPHSLVSVVRSVSWAERGRMLLLATWEIILEVVSVAMMTPP